MNGNCRELATNGSVLVLVVQRSCIWLNKMAFGRLLAEIKETKRYKILRSLATNLFRRQCLLCRRKKVSGF